MARAYLYLNAALYFVLALRSSFNPRSTSASLGYLNLSKRGQSEYLVMYGGLQIGLALIFFLLARNDSSLRSGLLVALCFYTPVVTYRVICALLYRPVASSTLGTILIESLLLLIAVWLYFKS